MFSHETFIPKKKEKSKSGFSPALRIAVHPLK